MKFIQPKRLVLIFFFTAGFWPINGGCVHPSPNVVVSIAPFHSLVAAVMQGVGTPKLLVKTGASPHQYSLRPSEIQSLRKASLIFWAGPQLETFLIKPLQNVVNDQKVHIVQLEKTPGLLLLSLRRSPAWEAHDHAHDHHIHGADNVSLAKDIDMHFWLDPNNAIIMTDSIVLHLSKLDPEHKDIYQRNGENLKGEIRQLDTNIAKTLRSVQFVPYIVFHDAYQYLENRYKLNGVGSITLHPEIPPSAKRLSFIRNIIKNTKARCVFTEPQFSPKLVQTIVQELHVKTGELDPIGQSVIKNDENGYIKLIHNLAHSIKDCLQEN